MGEQTFIACMEHAWTCESPYDMLERGGCRCEARSEGRQKIDGAQPAYARECRHACALPCACRHSGTLAHAIPPKEARDTNVIGCEQVLFSQEKRATQRESGKLMFLWKWIV